MLLFPMSNMFIQLVTISLRLTTTKLTCPLHEIKSMFSLYHCKTKVQFLILCVCTGIPIREKKTLEGNCFQNLGSLSYILSIFMFTYISCYNFGYLEFKFSLLIFGVRALCSENVLCIISAPKFYQQFLCCLTINSIATGKVYYPYKRLNIRYAAVRVTLFVLLPLPP